MTEESQDRTGADNAAPQEPAKDSACDCAEKSADEKMLPQKAKAKDADHGKKYSPWGVLIVIFALAFLLWVFGGKKSFEGASKLVPAGVSGMMSINCDSEVSGRLAYLPVWKNGEEASKRVIENLASGFASADKSALWRKLLGFCHWVTVARTVNDSKIYILDTGNLHAVEDIVCNEIATGFVKDRDTLTVGGFGPVRKLNTAKGEFFFIKMGTNAVLSDKLETLQMVINCYQETAPSLASIGVGLDSGELEQALALSYFVPVRSKRSYFLSAISELGGEGSCREDAGVVTRVRLLPDGLDMESRIVLNDEIAKAGESHGFFYYVGVAILLLLAIVIGVPGLFLLVLLVMAAYFYLVARWKGEIVPVDPPELPEMSPQMKQDMGQKPEGETEKSGEGENGK